MNELNEFITSNAHLVDVIIRTRFRPRTYSDYEELYSCGLVGLWKAYINYKAYKGQLTTYIWIVIQREIVRFLKQKKRWCSKTGYDDLDFAVYPKERLGDFLPNLSPEDEQILSMRVDGYTLKEIGDRVGFSIQVVHYRLKKIINLIREVNDIC